MNLSLYNDMMTLSVQRILSQRALTSLDPREYGLEHMMGPGLTYTYTGTLGFPYTGAFGSWWGGGGWITVTGSPPSTGTWPETTTTWSNIQEYMIQRPDQTY